MKSKSYLTYFLLTISALLFVGNLIAQTIAFEKTYDFSAEDQITDIIEIPGNNFLLIGGTVNTYGIVNILIVKIDSNGDTLCSRTFGGDSLAVANKIIHTSDGNYLIAGSLGINAFLLKINESCDSIWSKVYSDDYSCSFQNIFELSNAELMVTEWIWLLPTTSKLLRLSNTGELISTIISPGTEYVGLAGTSDDEIYLSGNEGDSYDMNYFLKKYDADGNLIFYQSFDEVHGGNSSLAIDGENIYLGGWKKEGIIGDPVIIKSDENGVIQWTRTFIDNYSFYVISMDIDGSARLFSIMDDYYLGEVYINALDQENNLIGHYTHDCNEPEMKTIIASGKDIFIGGSVPGNINGRDAYLVKIYADSIITYTRPLIDRNIMGLRLFPNPVKDFLHIKLHTHELFQGYNIRIIDNFGIEVIGLEGIITENSIDVDIHNLDDGIYLIKADIKNIGSIIDKFVVAR